MILYSLLAGENMIFVDLGNKNKTFCKKIINLLRKSDRKIIINSKYFEITKDNIKIINVENEFELISLSERAEEVLIFSINDYKKYADYCKKIILLYDSDNTYITKNRKKVNLEFKDIQDINDVLNVSKRKKDILRKNNFDIFMYFILATFIFVLSLLLINKNKLYNDSVKQNELLSKNISDLQEKNKNYTNYYFFIMALFFITYNIIFESLKISGSLYKLFMILLIIINSIVLFILNKKISFKKIILIIYIFTIVKSKNQLQFFFALSNIIILCIIGFQESNLIKTISIFILIITLTYSLPLLFVFLLEFGTELDEDVYMNKIYEDTHYYCNKNYEIYSYSNSAGDVFHYSIGKHYDFLNINDIIHITYNEQNEVKKYDYDNYLKKHKCRLVGDINESK